jgi:peptidoglycan/xylan/chitin deacetylase (PgdA/CDA1 family)
VRRICFGCVRWSGLPFVIRETLQRRRVTIMFAHDIDPGTLDAHLAVLRKRYSLVSLRDCIGAMESGRMRTLPPKPLALTFDDGLRGNFDLLGVFRKYAVTPTIFLCSGVAGTNRQFWFLALDDVTAKEGLKRVPDSARMEALAALGFDETADTPERTALSRSEIAEMQDVVDFQAHTVYHPILTRCDDARSWHEISGSLEALRRDFGLDIFAFAYPNGDYSGRELEFVAKAGYRCAVTTELGLNGAGTDVYRLKRIHLPTAASASEAIVKACVLPACLRQWLRGLRGRWH